MDTQEDINKAIETEISQAKKASFGYLIFHLLLAGSTIIAGAATTYVTAPLRVVYRPYCLLSNGAST
jgi:hypothetical protein